MRILANLDDAEDLLFHVPKSMNSLKAISLLFLGTALSVDAAPRFALVRVKDIYTELPSTVILQQNIKKERDGIMADQRAEELRRIIAELQSLQAQLSDKNNPLDEVTGKKIARNYEIKRQEAQTLQQEFENFKTEQEKAINKRMVTGMRKSLDRIAAASGKLGKERGFDAVIDSSGNTNTSVPFVLYSKNAPDLTEDIRAILKDAEPPMPAPLPAEKVTTPQPSPAPSPARAAPPAKDSGEGKYD